MNSILAILETLKGLVAVTFRKITMKINMPIALFGKVEQHNYYNPITVKIEDSKTAVETITEITETLQRHQRPVLVKPGTADETAEEC
ncbi:MAG: hypothetical protein FWE95_05285 [Planctomycetaceae bacterium]|nr:hypothetical protein [Planctomycetaceae bacterium]